MTRPIVLVILAVSVAGIPVAAQQPPVPSPELSHLAQEFVGLLTAEDFASAVARFDATMRQMLPADRLRET